MLARLRNIADRWIPKGQFAKGIVALSSGQFLSQLSTIIAAPFVTRMYTPAQFGIYGVYTTLLGMIGLVSSLKFDTAVALPREESTAVSLIRVSSLVNLAVTGVLILASSVAGKPLLKLLNAQEIQPYLWVVWVTSVLNGFIAILTAWALRNKQFTSVARANVYSSTGYSALQLGLGAWQTGVYGLLLADLSSRLTSIVQLARGARFKWSQLGGAEADNLWPTVKRYLRFPMLGVPQSLLNSIALNIPVLWLSASYGPQVVGLYALAQRVYMAPMGMFTGAISQVFLSASADLNRTNPSELERFFVQTMRRLFKAVIVPSVAIAVAGPWVFGLVFGERWLAAGTFVRILSPAYILGFAISPVSNVLNVIERQDAMLAFDLVRTSLIIASLLGARYLTVSANAFLAIYSGAMSVCYLYLFAVMLLAVRRRSRAQLNDRGT